jgi:hypothetical protein
MGRQLTKTTAKTTIDKELNQTRRTANARFGSRPTGCKASSIIALAV